MTTPDARTRTGRLPAGQYRVTAVLTGDDVGPDALGWLTERLLAIHGHIVYVESVTRVGTEVIATKPAPPVIAVHAADNRTVRVYVNGTQVGATSYDDVGWDGITLIDNIVTAIAQAADLPFDQCLDGDSCAHE